MWRVLVRVRGKEKYLARYVMRALIVLLCYIAADGGRGSGIPVAAEANARLSEVQSETEIYFTVSSHLRASMEKKSLMDSERILHCSLCRSAVYARRPLVLFALSYSTLSLQLRLKLIVAFVFFSRYRLISRRHLCAAAPHLYVDRVRSIQ